MRTTAINNDINDQGARAPLPDPYMIRLSYTSLLTLVSQVRHLHFLTIS